MIPDRIEVQAKLHTNRCCCTIIRTGVNDPRVTKKEQALKYKNAASIE